jgi:hypothetical protein
MNTPRDLIAHALHAKGWDRSKLIGALQRAGCVASRQKVCGWLGPGPDPSKPEAAIMGPLCDVLGLDPQAAADLYAACGYVLPAKVRALIDGPS